MDEINLINFMSLSLKEKKMILEWRNHKNIKRWMYNNVNIALDNHIFFIDSLTYTQDKLYFLVEKEGSFIGVINFTNIDLKNKITDFGLYSNPYLKGYGAYLLENICIYAFKILKIKILKAEVFIDNTKAIKLYKKFNFIETSRKVIFNNEILCMELKIEEENKFL